MNPIFLQIGPIKIYYYGLMYAISFFLGSEIAKKIAKTKGIKEEVIDNYAIVAMISGLLGGRLYYVLFNFDYYSNNLSEVLAVWKGGMAIHGGIIGGIIGTLIYGKIKRINPFLLSDIGVAPLFLGQTLGRIGNLMNGEIHGVPTFTPWNVIFTWKPKFSMWYEQYMSLTIEAQTKFKDLVPWGLTFPNSSPAGSEFPNTALHPAMLYESIMNFLGFLIILFLLRKKIWASGTVCCIYIILYSLIRIFVSFFRAEDLMTFGFRAPHFTSFVMIIISLIVIFIINKKSVKS
ncbi:MAG: prolipoprotein diacylglyceryl transferase [Fusobacteriaceae bacterium]